MFDLIINIAGQRKTFTGGDQANCMASIEAFFSANSITIMEIHNMQGQPVQLFTLPSGSEITIYPHKISGETSVRDTEFTLVS